MNLKTISLDQIKELAIQPSKLSVSHESNHTKWQDWVWDAAHGILGREDKKFFTVKVFLIQTLTGAQWHQPLIECATNPNGIVILPRLVTQDSTLLLITLRDEPGIPHKIWGPGFQASHDNEKGKVQLETFFQKNIKDIIHQDLKQVPCDGDRYYGKVNLVGVVDIDNPESPIGDNQYWVSLETLRAARDAGVLGEHLLTTMSYLV